MNQLILKIVVLSVAMFVLLVMALTTHNVIKSELFACFAIILGAYSSYQLSNKNNQN